jgi:hypothetical protein
VCSDRKGFGYEEREEGTVELALCFEFGRAARRLKGRGPELEEEEMKVVSGPFQRVS